MHFLAELRGPHRYISSCSRDFRPTVTIAVFGSWPLSLFCVDTISRGFRKLRSATVSKSATALLNSKPTYITIGDIQELPHADELDFFP
ncbi:hypothetical protein BDN72DRAFT_897525 [Pluteus cervinus]|uniref:Uncharacterized protein n=1 Tax=Pluteus cervinus TaxID=181527 RepID=A0ACD3AU84_9AGAR|nr:hypothetical protein BDN72DRAFT_897525 [Pluteus cervinus]